MDETTGISKNTLNFIVSENNNGIRLDTYLSARLEISRSLLKKMFDDDLISINGQFEKKSYRVEKDDHILCRVPLPPVMDLEPRHVDFEVIYEEEEWLLINKPSNLSVHPAAGQRMTTLVHGLLHRYPELHDTGEEYRPGIVHRLDRFTSGLLLVAKTNRVHKNLTAQFADRTIKKEYFAVVEGIIEYDENLVSEPIARHSKQRERMAVTPSGKESETFIVVDTRFNKHTSVNCFPKTGRRHQIRVHLEHLGHVIVGDNTYGAKVPVTLSSLQGHLSSKNEETIIPRLCLHARRLQFKDPLTDEERYFECDIPKDIQRLLDTLHNHDM